MCMSQMGGIDTGLCNEGRTQIDTETPFTRAKV